MKQIILSIALTLTVAAATAQTHAARSSVNYEAAGWKLRLLDNPQQLTITAPPTVAQSQAELKTVKQSMSSLDENKKEQIRYWNAGAPSYRWNEIAPKLIEQKPELMLRIPTAWMNLAIYDATILAWKEKIK